MASTGTALSATIRFYRTPRKPGGTGPGTASVQEEPPMQANENIVLLVGRIGLSLLFIHGGWGKLLAPAATQAMLASHHLPMVKYGWILAVVVELGGGLAILFGLFTRPVGLLLAIWCIATALIAHTISPTEIRRSIS